MRITLDRVTLAPEAAKTLLDMRRRYPDFLTLGQARTPETYKFEYLNSKGTKRTLGASDPLRINVTIDQPRVLKPQWVYVTGLCHLPDAVLEPPFTEESIQLLWMFGKMMRHSARAHKNGETGSFQFRLMRHAWRQQSKLPCWRAM